MPDLPEALPAANYAAELIDQLDRQPKWPPPHAGARWSAIAFWSALRDSEKDLIRAHAGPSWQGNDVAPLYRVDPLPEVISEAWAAYVWGEDPAVTPVQDADVEGLAELIDVNDLPSELNRAADIQVSEGETWWRLYVDQAVAPHPLIDWLSGACIIQYWKGRRNVANAIVTDLEPNPDDPKATYRHFEVHADGSVVNVLYRADKGDKLGVRVPLAQHPETEPLAAAGEVWMHELPMLVGRIPFRLSRRDHRRSVSVFHGIKDTLLDLNEAASIGSSNARLTARKRVVVPLSALRRRSGADFDDVPAPEEDYGLTDGGRRLRFDPTEQVVVEDPLNGELGKTQDQYRVIEYSFDAAALIAWKMHLVETAITRVGLTAQYTGLNAGNEGYAISGTALRLRLIPTDKRGRAIARPWDDTLPKILSLAARLDQATPQSAARGFGRQWASTDPPAVERRPGIPSDPIEEAQRHQTLYDAGLEALETAITDLHPDWGNDRVKEEVRRIRADKKAAAAAAPMFGNGGTSTEGGDSGGDGALGLPAA